MWFLDLGDRLVHAIEAMVTNSSFDRDNKQKVRHRSFFRMVNTGVEH